MHLNFNLIEGALLILGFSRRHKAELKNKTEDSWNIFNSFFLTINAEVELVLDK